MRKIVDYFLISYWYGNNYLNLKLENKIFKCFDGEIDYLKCFKRYTKNSLILAI